MGDKIIQVIIGLFIMAIGCTASYYFYELTSLHEVGDSLDKPLSILGKMFFGGVGLASCLLLLYILLKVAEYLGSLVWEKKKLKKNPF